MEGDVTLEFVVQIKSYGRKQQVLTESLETLNRILHDAFGDRYEIAVLRRSEDLEWTLKNGF